MNDSLETDPHDARLARLLAESRAESFGVYFADRVVDRVQTEARSARQPMRPARQLGWADWAGTISLRWRLATSMAAVVVLAVAAWALLGPKAIMAPNGEPTLVTLSDGTAVHLAPGSTLRWMPFLGRGTRAVELDGEGYFEVEHAVKPFVVATFDATVTVTGTRFNVRSWGSVARTEVALVDGSVLFDRRGSASGSPESRSQVLSASAVGPVTLRAGDTARIDDGGLPVMVDPGHTPEQASNWRSGGFAFRDRPLADLVHDLERRFATRIDADPSLLAERNVTYMNPGKPQLEEVLDAVSFALGLRYARTAQGWTLLTAESKEIPR